MKTVCRFLAIGLFLLSGCLATDVKTTRRRSVPVSVHTNKNELVFWLQETDEGRGEVVLDWRGGHEGRIDSFCGYYLYGKRAGEYVEMVFSDQQNDEERNKVWGDPERWEPLGLRHHGRFATTSMTSACGGKRIPDIVEQRIDTEEKFDDIACVDCSVDLMFPDGKITKVKVLIWNRAE